MTRRLFGLGPPEFAEFAERHTELNEVLWPALLSFELISSRYPGVPKETLIKQLESGQRDLLQFNSRDVFTDKGRQEFSGAICRLVVVSIASEFEVFTGRFWKRIQQDPKLALYSRRALFSPAKIANILGLLSSGASKANLIRACFVTELGNATSRFIPDYVRDVLAWQADTGLHSPQ
jgi:hypothetical protein